MTTKERKITMYTNTINLSGTKVKGVILDVTILNRGKELFLAEYKNGVEIKYCLVDLNRNAVPVSELCEDAANIMDSYVQMAQLVDVSFQDCENDCLSLNDSMEGILIG